MDLELVDEILKRTLITLSILMFGAVTTIYLTTEWYLKYLGEVGNNDWMPYGAFVLVVICILYQTMPLLKLIKPRR